jgi:geranylgeranyl diphosphate synthase type II
MFDLEAYLESRRRAVDEELERRLPPAAARPRLLHEAMRYSIFAGGKRLRPVLCMAAAEAMGRDHEVALPPAAALECLHTYSLIHDDLPAMDDDDLRRGRPTAHKQFGEARAILAGDALLTLAFELLACCPPPRPYAPAELVRELARAAGSRGMAGGQFEDLEAEDRPPEGGLVEYIHRHKTGALIRASCRMGAMAAGAARSELDVLSEYGRHVGLAFQVADDILNATSSAAELGKAAGSDRAHGKMTYVAVYGVEGARAKARGWAEAALEALEGLSRPAPQLAALARYSVERGA